MNQPRRHNANSTEGSQAGIRPLKDQGPRLRIGSLFSGIGGLEAGLEAAGVGSVVYQCEIEPFCRSVLKKHWPDAQLHEDVRLLDPRSLPPIHVLCGGFPCQDLSVSNARDKRTVARSGLQGSRSGLWSHMARIIGAQRPAFVVVENVAHGVGRWRPAVVRLLEHEGYQTICFPLECRSVGGHHRRKRQFVVGFIADANRVGLRLNQQRVPRGRARGLRDGRDSVASLPCPRNGWGTESELFGACHGVQRGPHHAARLKALGNAVVPQVASVLGYVIRELIDAGAAARSN